VEIPPDSVKVIIKDEVVPWGYMIATTELVTKLKGDFITQLDDHGSESVTRLEDGELKGKEYFYMVVHKKRPLLDLDLLALYCGSLESDGNTV